VELLDEAGLPKGVVNIVHGGGGTVGDRLVRHPDVPVVTLTGSRETGVAVMKNAADNLKHVHLELGGKNAIIVLDDADLDLAVEGIVWSAFGTSGQRCTAASRVIVHEAVYVEPDMRIAQEEIFGPTTALIRVRDFDEAVRAANGVRFGLSSSIFTRDVNRAFRAMRDLNTGITYVNAGTIGAEVHLPFGGTK